MAQFVPRASFPNLASIPRSYYLGHHASALSKMKTLITHVDLVIECRDYRAPLSSRNTLFESTLGERPRLIVYTKQDLGSEFADADRKREEIIRKWDAPSRVLFSDHKEKKSVRKVLDFAKEFGVKRDALTGSRLMVVGMPNVGKSSLLNALRNVGLGKKKAAFTGAQPGVTRKIGTSVKIIEAEEGGEGVYLLDTPGVFIPYVPDAESMLKLALCGSVKDTIVPPETIADYLLYHLNLQSPVLYDAYCEPTNEIVQLLDGVAQRTGRLSKGGIPDREASALWLVQRWRNGHLGNFVLDEVSEGALRRRKAEIEAYGGSMNQARRVQKEERRQRAKRRNVDVG